MVKIIKTVKVCTADGTSAEVIQWWRKEFLDTVLKMDCLQKIKWKTTKYGGRSFKLLVAFVLVSASQNTVWASLWISSMKLSIQSIHLQS